MADYIPGYAVLGYSFDVFGTYSSQSKIRPLFNMVFDGEMTYQDYLVPLNVNVQAERHSYGDSTYVDSRRKMEEHFAASLSVKAKYGFFSGQFDASYSMTNKSDVSYQFGIYQTYSQFFALDLQDRSENALAQWVRDDPDYQNIPDYFDDDNRELFFRFFDKYGIYYIPRVVVGARLYYSSTVSKSYNYSEQEAEAKLKLEYKSVFSASAEAQANWKSVGEDWASRREVKVETIGGNNEMLNVLLPGYGENCEATYKAWLESAEEQPVVIDFTLELISEIFSADKRLAVAEAIEEYLSHKLFIESKTGSCLINLDGEPVLPAPTYERSELGYQLAAIDRKTLQTAFARSYATRSYWGGHQELYENMLSDIEAYNTSDYIIAFTTFSNFAENAPTQEFVTFLESCGAGYHLSQWIGTKESLSGIYVCCSLTHCNYSFVGIPGSEQGAAHEAFSRTGSCDTGDSNWSYNSDWLDKPAPMVNLMIDLYTIASDSGMVAQLGRSR